MTFTYKDDAVKNEYEVKYDDGSNIPVSTFVTAYSKKQAEFYVKKNYPNCKRVIDVIQIKEIPDEQGKQIEMNFN